MITATPLTLTFSLALGAYMIAAGIGGLADPDRWDGVMTEMKNRPGLAYLTGAFVFTIGVAIVALHNIWTDWLAGLISLIGWGAVLEGLFLLAAPATFLNMIATPLGPRWIKPLATLAVMLGVILVFFGLTGQTT